MLQTEILLGNCIDAKEALWRVDTDGLLHALVDDSKCMQAASGQTIGNGSKMRIFPCDSTRSDQIFDLELGLGNPIHPKSRPDVCVVFRGINANIGEDPIILKSCDNIKEDRLYWNVLEI